MTDHLAALFLSADRGGSHGRYEPGLFDLHLSGNDLVDHMVHYHEAHHVLLTATTAWGAALLTAADMPVWEGLFDRLLRECRSTHESFATYMSCSVLTVGRGSSAMAAYPRYRMWLERLERYLAAITGARRRALAVTALARACMQTPVLGHMLRSWPNSISIGQIRRLDRPDERFEYLLGAAGGLPAAVVASADEAVLRVYGAEPLSADIADEVIALDDALDPAWALWDETVCDGLAEQLRGVGATVIDGNGHLDTASELFHLVRGVNPASRLGVDAGDPSDQQTARLVLSHARLWLSVLRRPGRLVTVGLDVDVADVVQVADANNRIAGRPNMVISARLPHRLLAGYDFPSDEAATLASMPGPVVGVRSLADAGEDTISDAMTETMTETVWLARLPEPSDAVALAAAWTEIGDLSCCVATSCLLDDEWRRAWLPVLQKLGPLVWLIDVGISSLATELGGGRRVHGLYLDLGPSSIGVGQGVAFRAEGLAGVWLAVANEFGIQLVTAQIAATPGIELTMTGADWSEYLPALRLVIADLLHTESYVDLRAAAGRPGHEQ